jgi:hypothetical protein
VLVRAATPASAPKISQSQGRIEPASFDSNHNPTTSNKAERLLSHKRIDTTASYIQQDQIQAANTPVADPKNRFPS